MQSFLPFCQCPDCRKEEFGRMVTAFAFKEWAVKKLNQINSGPAPMSTIMDFKTAYFARMNGARAAFQRN